MEILQEFSVSNDQTSIVKRKRTKRPRPSSSTSSSGVCTTAAGGCGGGEFHNSVSISSPTTSSTGLSTTTEEEDMAANCLILLARGGNSRPQAEEEIKSAEKKFNSRKFTEMPTTTDGKVGIYVYECKTCNRTFPSFQALGGHRASHKKPKLAGDAIDRKKLPPMENREEEDCGGANGKITVTQLPSRIRHLKNKAKTHECSICGSEFGSGQALGGHMRRHRSAAGTNSNLKIGTIIDAAETSSIDASNATSEKAPNMLSLDLNMPAPEDDRSEENFNRFSPDRQPQLLFSAGALVDCHY